MKNTKELFRENLRKILQRSGYNLADAAAECRISLSFLNQLLSGKKGYTDETLDKICEGLKCTQAELFYDSSAKPDLAAIESKSNLILSIQASLTSMDERQLRLVAGFINDLREHDSGSSSAKASDAG